MKQLYFIDIIRVAKKIILNDFVSIITTKNRT